MISMHATRFEFFRLESWESFCKACDLDAEICVRVAVQSWHFRLRPLLSVLHSCVVRVAKPASNSCRRIHLAPQPGAPDTAR